MDIKLATEGKLTEQPPIKSIRPQRVQYDLMELKQTEKRLQALNRPQKEVIL